MACPHPSPPGLLGASRGSLPAMGAHHAWRPADAVVPRAAAAVAGAGMGRGVGEVRRPGRDGHGCEGGGGWG